ncbi:MAG: radical SAM protein [Pseudomonadota bacterium]
MTDNYYNSICCFRSPNKSTDRRLLWELTTRCNLNCPTCHRYGQSVAEWSYEDALNTIPFLKRQGIKDVILSGGEPLLLPWLEELIQRLHQSNFNVDICTNATLVNEGNVKILASYLSEISVSLESSNASVHDKHRKQIGAWGKTIKAIELLIKNGLMIHIISVLTEETMATLTETIAMCHQLGVESVTLLGLMPYNTKSNFLANATTQAQLSKILNDCRKKYTSLTINTKRTISNMPFCECDAGNSIFALDAKGEFLPCILLSQLGKESWSKLKAFRSEAIKNANTACLNCDFSTNCKKGCPASSFIERGGLGVDSLCLIAAEAYKKGITDA